MSSGASEGKRIETVVDCQRNQHLYCDYLHALSIASRLVAQQNCHTGSMKDPWHVFLHSCLVCSDFKLLHKQRRCY